MGRKVFEKLHAMNMHDAENNTDLVSVCTVVTGVKTTRQGGTVEIGVPQDVALRVSDGSKMAFLVIVDKAEFKAEKWN